MTIGPLDRAVEEARKALLMGGAAAGDTAQRLYGAAFVIMQLHREDKLYLSASDEDHPDACPHDPENDYDEHFEGDDGIWYCTSRPAGVECRCGAEWPCGEYVDVLAAITGRGWGDRDAIRAELTTPAAAERGNDD